jgi:hypothetical protein
VLATSNMASSVFYKFKSQKDESRVTFDGTGISVFDLKREVILVNNMTRANDFDLYVYDATSNQGTNRDFCLPALVNSYLSQNITMTPRLSLAPPLSSSSACLLPNPGKEKHPTMLQVL